MIHFAKPYDSEKNYLDAINREMDKIQNPKDWLCILDGDTMFLQPDFGHQLEDYVRKYPGTGMFVSYASRCSYGYQVPDGVDQDNPSIIYHKMKADQIRDRYQGKAKVINTRISGHLMLLQKITWDELYPVIHSRVKIRGKKILGVDTQISWAIIKSGRKIRLMQGVYLLHYCRLLEGKHIKTHLE